MSVVADSSQAVGGGGVTTLTTPAFTISSTADRAAMICLESSASISAITMSVGGVSGSAITGADSGGANRAVIFGAIAPPSGSQTATASWTTSSFAVLGVLVGNGVDQTTAFNNGVNATGTSASASGTVTSNPGDLTVGTTEVTAVVSSSNQTLVWNGSPGGASGAGSYGTGGVGTTTHTFTLAASAAWGWAGANFIQASPPTAPLVGASMPFYNTIHINE